MSKGLIIAENLMARSNALVVATSEASSTMAALNLCSEEPSKFWRSASNAPKDTSFYGYLSAQPMAVKAVALVNHNLYRGDQYRIHTEGGTFSTPAGYTGYNPTSTVGAVAINSTATFDDVNNGESSPGTTWAVPTVNTTAWQFGVGFGTITVAPQTGAKKQAFWVYAKKSASTSYQNPTVACFVYEGGSVFQATSAKAVTSLTGQWLFFEWDATGLAASDGSGVQCVLSMSVLGTDYVSIGSVVWAEDCQTVVNDSGWITYDPFASLVTFRPEAELISKSSLYTFPALVYADYIYVHIRSCRSPGDYAIESDAVARLHGFVKVGCLVIGDTFSPEHERGHGPYFGVIDLSSKGMTDGGQVFGSRRPVLRTLSWPLPVLSKAEGMTIMERLVMRHGSLKKYFVHLAPDDDVEGDALGFMATLKSAETVMSTTGAVEGGRSVTLEFVEAL